MAAIFGERKFFFENWQEYIFGISCGSKISTKSLYLARLRRYKQISVFAFLAKIRNGRLYWGEENFLKIARSTLLRYPVGRKFRQNHSISHDLRDRHVYVFYYVVITQEVNAITINNNTKQATDPINLHTKFYKDELNMFPFKRVKTEMQVRVGSK